MELGRRRRWSEDEKLKIVLESLRSPRQVSATARRFERELIRTRTGEGRARAKAKGVHMGRPRKLTAHQRREAVARRHAGESLTDIARTFGISHTTIGRLTANG